MEEIVSLTSEVDIELEFTTFIDCIAPKLGVYEQTIYLYLLRRSLKLGTDLITLGVKSERLQMGFGSGDAEKSMSENTASKKIQSLVSKKLVLNLGSDRVGTRLQIIWPTNALDYLPITTLELTIDPIEFDCFHDPLYRMAILHREEHKCFYCLTRLDDLNHVMEHVVSRPEGNNSYLNIVAGCRRCNNKKGSRNAENFLRDLYREGFLSENEFRDRLIQLEKLISGKLVPKFGII